MKEATPAVWAISCKRGSSMLANELFKIYQVKNWLWVIKWMKTILVVSIYGMRCLRGLGHVSKRSLHRNVCCSTIYQMLRRKNAVLKNPGVGRIHHRQNPQWVVKELSHCWCSVGLQCAEDEALMSPGTRNSHYKAVLNTGHCSFPWPPLLLKWDIFCLVF